MVLAWIAIGLGILIAVALIVKLLKTPRYESISMTRRCKKCGDVTLGVKCPRCDGASNEKKFYK